MYIYTHTCEAFRVAVACMDNFVCVFHTLCRYIQWDIELLTVLNTHESCT